MDVNIYTVLLDNDDYQIISHSNDESIPGDLEKYIGEITKKDNIDSIYIGNLYFDKYSYKYYQNSRIIIIDNSASMKKLRSSLILSVILFVVLEGVFFIISFVIANWITKPVDASFKRQKEFIADASHELKTPLSVIIASSEALENDKNEKWISNIKNESLRMSKLIKDLLDLAKLEDEEIPLIFEDNNLSKLVEMSILPLESLIYEKNIHYAAYRLQRHHKHQCPAEGQAGQCALQCQVVVLHDSQDLGKSYRRCLFRQQESRHQPD